MRGMYIVVTANGGDDDELSPLEGVRGAVEHEEEEDQPTPTLLPKHPLEEVPT